MRSDVNRTQKAWRSLPKPSGDPSTAFKATAWIYVMPTGHFEAYSLQVPLHNRDWTNIGMSSPNRIVHQCPKNHRTIHKHRPVHTTGFDRSCRWPQSEEPDGRQEEQRGDIDRQTVFAKRPSPRWQWRPPHTPVGHAANGDIIASQEGHDAEGDNSVQRSSRSDIDQ